MVRRADPEHDHGHGHLWSMGAVSRATGIGEHTLRAWEKRFGFPRPLRLPSGHRRFTTGDVSRLRLIARALQRGHRAGEVVPMAPEVLYELLGEPADRAAEVRTWLTGALELVRGRRRSELAQVLRHQMSELGAAAAMVNRIAPLLEEVGVAWAGGELSVGHEHFVSNVVEDVLRQARLQLEPGLTGAPTVFGALPGERHLLGLHMAALQMALCGRSLHLLGADTPVDEIVAAARQLASPAVAISLSVTGASPEAREELATLRGRLPKAVRLLLGGAGVARLGRLPDASEAVPTLADLGPLVASLPDNVPW